MWPIPEKSMLIRTLWSSESSVCQIRPIQSSEFLLVDDHEIFIFYSTYTEIYLFFLCKQKFFDTISVQNIWIILYCVEKNWLANLI